MTRLRHTHHVGIKVPTVVVGLLERLACCKFTEQIFGLPS